jgi:RNA 2',3'-cyclic 3'-phosphodiesterase
MDKFLRTFIAVRIEPGLQLIQALRGMQDQLAGEPVKWTQVGNLHLTLKFLGETSHGQVEKVMEELDLLVRSFQPFTCHLQGVGFFKSQGMPRVLFMHVADPEGLQRVASELNRRLAGAGFGSDAREFTPHLTIARMKYLKDKSTFYQMVEKYRDHPIQPLHVRELVFYRSMLHSSGPVYKPLVVKKLAGSVVR